MKRPLPVATAFFVLMLVVMRAQGAPLAAHVPGGILGLEFAWSDVAFLLRLEWMGRKPALVNIWLDFLFIAAYVWFFAAAALALRGRFGSGRVPRIAARMAVLAGLFDVVENVAMLGRIYGWLGPVAPPVAYVCAAIKFLLLAAVLLFLLNARFFRKRVDRGSGPGSDV